MGKLRQYLSRFARTGGGLHADPGCALDVQSAAKALRLTPPLEVLMKALIEYIARSLVDHPEDVQVSEVEGEQTTVLELKVAKEDLGKVIGKQGRTARAMRTILSAASIKCKKRTVLEIME